MPGNGSAEGFPQTDSYLRQNIQVDASIHQPEFASSEELMQTPGEQSAIQAAVEAGAPAAAVTEQVTFKHVHANGKEFAGTLEQAQKVCPVIGKMSVENAQRTLQQSDRQARMAERGRQRREAAEAAKSESRANTVRHNSEKPEAALKQPKPESMAIATPNEPQSVEHIEPHSQPQAAQTVRTAEAVQIPAEAAVIESVTVPRTTETSEPKADPEAAPNPIHGAIQAAEAIHLLRAEQAAAEVRSIKHPDVLEPFTEITVSPAEAPAAASHNSAKHSEAGFIQHETSETGQPRAGTVTAETDRDLTGDTIEPSEPEERLESIDMPDPSDEGSTETMAENVPEAAMDDTEPDHLTDEELIGDGPIPADEILGETAAVSPETITSLEDFPEKREGESEADTRQELTIEALPASDETASRTARREEAIDSAPLSPDLPAPVLQIESAITRIHEMLDQESTEELKTVHNIIEQIIRLPKNSESDPADKTAFDRKLEEFFVELFDEAQIGHTPELIESFVKLTGGHYLEELWQELEELQGDVESLPDEIGTREFLQKLRQSLHRLQKKLRHFYEIGKSVLHLCDLQPVLQSTA